MWNNNGNVLWPGLCCTGRMGDKSRRMLSIYRGGKQPSKARRDYLEGAWLAFGSYMEGEQALI